MSKLFVAGCSFSDFTKVRKVYGQYLAEKLNYDYVHEAAGCGSNWRMWRVITNHILNKNLTENDLLVVQYSGAERTEFWTGQYVPDHAFVPEENDHATFDKYQHGGTITRFKAESYKWQHSAKDKKLHHLYQEFINYEFEKERFTVHNEMFQQLLKNYNIKTIFIKNWRYGHESYVNIIPHYSPYVFYEEKTPHSHALNLTNIDHSHLNDKGHMWYADMLFEHIHHTKIL